MAGVQVGRLETNELVPGRGTTTAAGLWAVQEQVSAFSHPIFNQAGKVQMQRQKRGAAAAAGLWTDQKQLGSSQLPARQARFECRGNNMRLPERQSSGLFVSRYAPSPDF